METGNGRISRPSNDDSFDEEAVSDVDDEVFIKSARNGFRNKDKILQKPLMAPRKKSDKDKKLGAQNGRSNGSHLMEIHTTSPRGSPVMITILYVAIAVGSLAGLAGLIFFLTKYLPAIIGHAGVWRPKNQLLQPLTEPCNSFLEEAVWDVNLPHTIADGYRVITSLDINNDSIEDSLIGFDSGLNGVTPLTSFLCYLYLNTTSTVCDGGLVAINGSNGAILWTSWLDDAVTAVQCQADLDLDGVNDCIAVGKSRSMWAISTANGKLLWGISTDRLQLPCLTDSAFRSAQTVDDVSGDSVPDLVVAIKSASGASRSSKCPDYIASVNGYTGSVLQLTGTADQRPISIGPLLKASGDGSTFILYSTHSGGNASSSCSLFMVTLNDVLTGRKDLVRTIMGNTSRIEEIVVADVTDDGMEDLILLMDNRTVEGKDVVALNGFGFRPLWAHTASAITLIRVQTLANLDGDNLPDIAVQMTGQMLKDAKKNSTWIRVLSGRSGQVLANLPPRQRRWQVSGESLAVEGLGADIVVDWIAGEEEEEGKTVGSNGRLVNRLMGFSSRGELPGIVVYSTPAGSSVNRPVSYGVETSLHDVLDAVANRDDLRAKFSDYILHTESERMSEEDAAAAAPQRTEELEPNSVGYPVQHGIRKHGRWNGPTKHDNYRPSSSYDYDIPPPPPPPPVPRYRKPQDQQRSTGWKDSVIDPSGNDDEDSPYVTDYGDGNPSLDYETDGRDYGRRYQKAPSVKSPSPPSGTSWGSRRGKRIRRQIMASGSTVAASAVADQPTESVHFPPSVLNGGSDGSVDLVFGVQWSWSEPEEREEQLRQLALCVTRRLDSGRALSDDSLVDYAAECSQSLLLRIKAEQVSQQQPVSGTTPVVDKLVASAVDRWLRPLARRLHGWVNLKRLRLRCQCQAPKENSLTTAPGLSNIRRPCSSLLPVYQRRRIDFNY